MKLVLIEKMGLYCWSGGSAVSFKCPRSRMIEGLVDLSKSWVKIIVGAYKKDPTQTKSIQSFSIDLWLFLVVDSHPN